MPFNSFNFWLIFPFIFGIYWQEYFKEPMHLNDDGAREYPAEIIKRLKV